MVLRRIERTAGQLLPVATILGMIPISHQVFWDPMAYAIISGLTGGTVLTLTLLPALLRLLLGREAAAITRSASLDLQMIAHGDHTRSIRSATSASTEASSAR